MKSLQKEEIVGFHAEGKNRRSINYNHLRHKPCTGDKPFSCSQCDYKSTSSDRKTHARIHTSKKPLSCSHCDYASSYSSHLKRHLRIHTDEKPFSCSQCDYKSSYSSTLKIHERIHTGEKPFSCSQFDHKCSGDLQKHARSHTNCPKESM